MTQPITVSIVYGTNPTTASAPIIKTSPNTSIPLAEPVGGVIKMISEYSLLLGRRIPLVAPMISFTAGLASFGYSLARILMPGGPAITGYLLGSLFIGLIYVLPVSALISLYKASKTKRQLNLRALAPLAIIWVVALALILLSPSIAVLQNVVAMLQILLMIATMLLIPLAIAFRMSKLAT